MIDNSVLCNNFLIDCLFANLLLEFHTKSPPKGHVVTRY